MRQSPETWMINGKPGEILALLAQAARQTTDVDRETKGQGKDRMTYRSAEAIKRAARVLAELGVVTIWETSEARSEKSYAEVTLSATFVAPDGSYVVHSVRGAANAGMGRATTVATTAATKIIYGLALQMADGDGDPATQPPDEKATPAHKWSASLHAIVVAIDRSQNRDELDATTKLEQWADLDQTERAIAQQEGDRRFRWLTRYTGGQR